MSVIFHDLSTEDAQTMANVREMISQGPRPEFIPSFRSAFDGIISHTPEAGEITYEPGEVGGVSGWWCRPAGAAGNAAILYIHGGGYVIGSSTAYKNFVGHIAKYARTSAFIAEYRLAPEFTFPSPLDDVEAVYHGLVALGFERIAVCGDSAGGGLALSFLQRHGASLETLVGGVALSPWLDLTLSGDSMISRSESDPIISKETLAEAVKQYLGPASLDDERLATLEQDFSSLPPVRVHVGDCEVLLDDALRFSSRADEFDRACEVHVWAGMIHVFLANPGILHAAKDALADVGSFLSERLAAPHEAL